MIKPHPREAAIPDSDARPNRFIFGDALNAQGLEPCEYVVHTEAPGFICRLVGNDRTPFEGREQRELTSAMLYDDVDERSFYVCNQGLRLFDFHFTAEAPTAEVLQAICDEAIKAYLRLQEIYRAREMSEPSREMRVVADAPLPPTARAESISSLARLALEAELQPVSRMQLTAQVQQALSGGDPAVLTEAQLGLSASPQARALLLKTARDCIARPEVVREDGSILSFDLWALPFIFSRAEGGSWWHFPMLERIEPVLADALGLPPQATLWVSPTIFTIEMLQERYGQDLIHLASVMDAGCDYAPLEPEAARATYDAARQTRDPRLLVAFIPFLVERDALTAEQARRHGRRALEAVLPAVQEAIALEMPYGEAELYAPLPWWEALAAGTGGMNRRRLGLTLAVVAAQLGSLQQVVAQAEYQPEAQGYHVVFRHAEHGGELASTSWLLVQDLAPDRERGWAALSASMQEAGIPLTELSLKLH